MRIPVFVSCPTSLSPEQNAAREVVLQKLAGTGLELRAVAVAIPWDSQSVVHDMPSGAERSEDEEEALDGVFLKWQAEVRHRYYTL